MKQETEHRIWKIVELFYKSLHTFQQIHETYEAKVLEHCKRTGLPREDLHLSPKDLAGLLDFQTLEELRDHQLLKLKDLCHNVFRDRDSTEFLDRYVSDIFHELSILKEEHYTVKHYAPYWAQAHAQVELQSIMEEAAKVFPRKVHHVEFLFRTALTRLEELLPRYRNNKILIRSLFLNRKGFVSRAYEHGIEGFYIIMYGEGGPLRGYLEAGKSFLGSSFHEKSVEAFQSGLQHAKRNPELSPEERETVKSITKLLDEAEEAMEKKKEVQDSPSGHHSQQSQ